MKNTYNIKQTREQSCHSTCCQGKQNSTECQLTKSLVTYDTKLLLMIRKVEYDDYLRVLLLMIQNYYL